MKKKLLTLSITSLVFIAFAVVMLFVPFTFEDKGEMQSFFATMYFLDAEEIADIIEEVVTLPLLIYPIAVVVTAIFVVKTAIKNIKFAKNEGVALPKKVSTNLIFLLIVGILAWALSIVFFIDENQVLGAFVYAPFVYVIPTIALMIVNGEMKTVRGAIKKEMKKQAKKAKAEAEAAAAAEAPVQE